MDRTGSDWTETELARAWKLAAEDLGIEFISPFTFCDQQGIYHVCSGLIAHFGRAAGTLIVSRNDPEPEIGELGYELGFYTSALNPNFYETYDRECFVETLRDWGWYGATENLPSWMKPSTECHAIDD